jgi:hypothetical protein
MDLSAIDAMAIQPMHTSRPFASFPLGLISDPQSLMSLQFRLRVPPFTSASLALSRCFTLTDVTTGSQAPGFTITTASSADHRPITDHVSASLRA